MNCTKWRANEMRLMNTKGFVERNLLTYSEEERSKLRKATTPELSTDNLLPFPEKQAKMIHIME